MRSSMKRVCRLPMWPVPSSPSHAATDDRRLFFFAASCVLRRRWPTSDTP